jgi:hypothetical protein
MPGDWVPESASDTQRLGAVFAASPATDSHVLFTVAVIDLKGESVESYLADLRQQVKSQGKGASMGKVISLASILGKPSYHFAITQPKAQSFVYFIDAGGKDYSLGFVAPEDSPIYLEIAQRFDIDGD